VGRADAATPLTPTGGFNITHRQPPAQHYDNSGGDNSNAAGIEVAKASNCCQPVGAKGEVNPPRRWATAAEAHSVNGQPGDFENTDLTQKSTSRRALRPAGA
jgi:hypothetical protein